MLYLTGIIITFFLAAVLISKKNKSTSDTILAIWLGLIGLHLQLFYLHFTGQYIHFPHLLGLEIPMPLLHGPLLFLYIKALISPTQQSFKWLFHFLPAIAAYALVTPFLLLSAEKKIITYQNNGAGFETLTTLIFISLVLSGLMYVVLCWRLLNRHLKNAKPIFSVGDKINTKWILYLIYGIAAIWIVVILGNDALIFASVTVFSLLIGYLGIKDGNIFTNYNVAYNSIQTTRTFDIEINAYKTVPKIGSESDHQIREVPEKPKYQKSTLKEEDAIKIHTQLQELMQVEKLFKNPELSLSDLAERLSIHQNTLSQVINSFEEKHFYDYINELRIEAFKGIALTADSRKYTLLSLAFDCGFNSKTTFNRTFKKSMGISPKEYMAKFKEHEIK